MMQAHLHTVESSGSQAAEEAMLALYAVDPDDAFAGRRALQAAVDAVTLELARRGDTLGLNHEERDHADYIGAL